MEFAVPLSTKRSVSWAILTTTGIKFKLFNRLIEDQDFQIFEFWTLNHNFDSLLNSNKIKQPGSQSIYEIQESKVSCCFREQAKNAGLVFGNSFSCEGKFLFYLIVSVIEARWPVSTILEKKASQRVWKIQISLIYQRKRAKAGGPARRIRVRLGRPKQSVDR